MSETEIQKLNGQRYVWARELLDELGKPYKVAISYGPSAQTFVQRFASEDGRRRAWGRCMKQLRKAMN